MPETYYLVVELKNVGDIPQMPTVACRKSHLAPAPGLLHALSADRVGCPGFDRARRQEPNRVSQRLQHNLS